MDIKSLNPSLVNNRLNDSAPRGQAEKPNAGAGANNAATGTPKSADKVTLTSISSQVKDLETKAADSKIDQTERLESIKAAIKDGSYHINTQNIAAKLIQTESLLAGA